MREREGFLWLPATVHGETRWLEFARWREQYATAPKGGYQAWWKREWLP